MSFRPALETLAQDLARQITRDLPDVLQKLVDEGLDPLSHLQLDCVLRSSISDQQRSERRIASVDISQDVRTTAPPTTIPHESVHEDARGPDQTSLDGITEASSDSTARIRERDPHLDDDTSRPSKRRATGALTISRNGPYEGDNGQVVARRLGSDGRVFPQRKKKLPERPSLQPSTLEKFIGGVWESIFSSVRMDPSEVIEQWQAIESSGQPKLLTETDSEIAMRDDSAFGRMNVLARKISQTSRACRSLEVIVQAHWVQAFDDRVAELTVSMTKDKAKKAAMTQACVDFNWTEKELRNKMGIWRGYHDIKNNGGWTAIVFAGAGLYRFCKYRVSFTEETFATLRALRHRFEVAADTLHPRWRSLLAIVGAPTERKYTGHPHDWVVCAPGDEAVPLPTTYHQWDKDFSYAHLEESVIDEDAWGLFDPRTVVPATEANPHVCQTCGQKQADDPRLNACSCFPNLYGGAKPIATPVQVYRTPNGKNNGLLACCAFERGAAVGEFVGLVTSGLAGKDVMFGQTERSAYQIWQGRQGNHSRFVNHSCQPNSQFERFVWLGIQRIVLVSKGIEAGEEITVDYSDTYWKGLDKECLCGQPKCRYRNRQLLTPPEST